MLPFVKNAAIITFYKYNLFNQDVLIYALKIVIKLNKQILAQTIVKI